MTKIVAILLIALPSLAHAQVGALINAIGAVGSMLTKNITDEQKKEEQQAAKDANDAQAEQKKQAQIEKQHEAELEAEQHEKDLKSGKVQAQDFDDLVLLYDDGSECFDLANSPLLKPDQQICVIYGRIERELNGYLIAVTPKERGRFRGDYFAVAIDGKTKRPRDVPDGIRINGQIAVYGKYTKNLKYNTIGGETKIMPVFQARHIVFSYSHTY